jgi:hypothetical protein
LEVVSGSVWRRWPSWASASRSAGYARWSAGYARWSIEGATWLADLRWVGTRWPGVGWRGWGGFLCGVAVEG